MFLFIHIQVKNLNIFCNIYKLQFSLSIFLFYFLETEN